MIIVLRKGCKKFPTLHILKGSYVESKPVKFKFHITLLMSRDIVHVNQLLDQLCNSVPISNSACNI